jgi:alpha-mannosidase
MYHQIRWTPAKIEQRLRLIAPLVYRERQPLAPFRCLFLAGPEVPAPVAPSLDDSGWAVVEPYSYWAGVNTTFVLRGAFRVPDAWSAHAPLALYLPLGEPGSFSHPEALIYIDGVSLAACDRHHQEVWLPPDWADGQPHTLALHGWTGNSHREGREARLMMRPCELVQIDPPTRAFVVLANAALRVANRLADDSPAKSALYNALEAAFNCLDTREPFGEEFYASVPEAYAALLAGVQQAGPPMDVQVFAAGHAHIDVAWLWTLAQTRHKAARTFHTVLHLMQQFPDYTFTQSQPQLYEFVRQDHPALFEGIRQRVTERRWEPIGGMWVEADSNLTGAESLARQFLLGRTYFREHFGPDADSPVLWLPDVFGYTWTLPQLAKLAGLDYFFTVKIGWGQYNRLPYDSFWWQGLDGTRILAHFSTTPESDRDFPSTYNAHAHPEDGLRSWHSFQQKDVSQDLLMVYGFGDGGGGPTREMLENIQVMEEFPGVPRTRHATAHEFFQQMEANAGDRLPVWNGELYLELHRGTYTTQSRNKRANRKSEFLLHDAEFLASFARTLDPDHAYPAADLHDAWQLVCLNQFHDIIPGSSITPVYVDSQEQYAEIRAIGQRVRDDAVQTIARHVSGDVLLVNPTSFTRDDLAHLDAKLETGLVDASSQPVLHQPLDDGSTLIAPPALAPYSVTPLRAAAPAQAAPDTGLHVTPTRLENRFLRLELDRDGNITRIFDKEHDRDVLPPGAVANQFQAFEDRPMNWDAWDIDVYYDDRLWTSGPASSVKVIADGPLRAVLRIERQILNSPYRQTISLDYNSRCLRFDTVIDWRERHILLKVAFPVDILAPQATYEIQWGSVERPTHRNTSWDWARFETCAHKWVDLSEGDYGVSLLNDCKYGHDVRDNVLRLSLLRSPTSPDPQADTGEHHFTYALYPHGGTWRAGTIPQAYALNNPTLAYRTAAGGTGHAAQLVWTDRPNAIIETVKWAEDGNGLIVRLYESQRMRGPVTLHAGFDIQAAFITNLLEETQNQLPVADRQVKLDLQPFQIVTLRLTKDQ